MHHGPLTLAIAASFVVAALAAVPDAQAQGNLLQQGRDLLGTVGRQGSSGPSSSAAGGLSTADIGAGLIEALRVGTERVVGTVGQVDGYNKNPDIHIPLPDTLRQVQKALGMIGAGGMADDLELRLNRAAETAAPQAKQLFWDAIAAMTIDDVERIYRGPSDAATQYFRGKMSSPLAARMKPIVDASLAEAGAVRAYDQVMGRYKTLPLVPDVKADLTTHVLTKAIDGMFLYLGREEAAIRQNPAARSTDLLKKVFGAS